MLTPWKKGQSGNPKGRPPILDPAVRRAAEENKTLFKATVNKYLRLPPGEIKELAKREDLSTLEHVIAQGLANAITDKYLPHKLLEMAMGQLIEEPDTLSQDEKLFLARYRELRDASASQALPAHPGDGSATDPSGS